jgi:hypothetical protein
MRLKRQERCTASCATLLTLRAWRSRTPAKSSTKIKQCNPRLSISAYLRTPETHALKAAVGGTCGAGTPATPAAVFVPI